MKALAGSLQNDEEILRELWQQRLPSDVQTFLAIHPDNTELDKRAEIADKIFECLQRRRLSHISASGPSTERSNWPDRKAMNVTQSTSWEYRRSASPTLIGDLCKMLTALTKGAAELKRTIYRSSRPYNQRPRSRGNGRNQDGPTQGTGICYYHRRFKEKAHECTLPFAMSHTFKAQGYPPASQ